MVSNEHEIPLDLIRGDPGLIAEILGSLGITVPPGSEPLLDDPTLNDIKITEHQADGIVQFRSGGKTVLAVVIESQLRWVAAKRRDWFPYLVNLWARRDCPCVLLVFTSDEKVAESCRRPIEIGHPGVRLVPLVIGPSTTPIITDQDQARHSPQLAVLSAAAHGNGQNRYDVLRAFAAALAILPGSDASIYTEYVAGCLEPAAAKILEDLVTAATFPHHLSFTKAAHSEGKAEGTTLGTARSVLRVLASRGVELKDAQRDQILACADLEQLDTWLVRAATADTADEVFGE